MNARAIISKMTAVMILSVIFIAQQTAATTRYVSQDGSGSQPYKTWESAATNIQDAVDRALPGDIILIDDGIYRVTNTIVVNKSVTIKSANGKDAVVIDGKGIVGCFQLNTAGAVLDGLTISNGVNNAGGGINMHAGTVVENSTIVACKASAGGGIWFEQGGYVDNCLIIANYASSQGGGAYMDNGGVITNSVMAGNYVKTHGGAAYIMKDGLITDSILTNNTAVNDGGAVNFNNGGLLDRCYLSANKADKGGAVNIFKASIRNCLIVGNTAVDGGGGYLKSGSFIESCTVADNEASSEADGLFFSAGGYLLNSIVYHNGTQNFQKDGSGMDFAYSCVTPDPGGIGIVTDDPMFVDRFRRDYHLQRESPAVDVGDNQLWMIDGVDLDGFPRIWNDIVDMGCFELVNPIFIDITTTPQVVEYEVLDIPVAGTNNEYVVGGMTVENMANNTSETFPSALAWTTPRIPLALGRNTIVVSGTNTYGASGSDSVIITRLGGPHVAITSAPAWVSYEITEYAVVGTNNEYVVGGMVAENTANGSVTTFAAADTWTTPVLPLETGNNLIVVTGTNKYGDTASDSITITRGPIGTEQPFVDITNENTWVAYDVSVYTISGTNNIHVVGTMTWDNQLTGDSGTLPAAEAWTVTDIPLGIGDNIITVTGTNLLSVAASDSITIIRGDPGTGMPFIDVTTTPTVVRYEITDIAVAGTNNPNVVGEMSVSNTANGYSRSFPATAAWITPLLPLAVGENILVVSCTNALGQRAEDSVTIIREGLVIGRPFVDITTTPVIVEHQVTELPVAGTNNQYVVGGMQAVNTANSSTYSCDASTAWIFPSVTLDYGLNEIHVTGTNMYGETSSDSVLLVRRLSSENELAITFPNLGENYQVSYGEHSTNFAGYVTAVPEYLCWSNTITRSFGILDNEKMFSFSAMLPIGINRIIVVAVVDGETLRDEMSIIVNAPPADPDVDVLATWPELIGATQTGTIEFVTTLEGVYTVFADTATGPVAIATGTCTAGWNLVDFYGGDLPNQLGSDLSNTLRIQVNESSVINASTVRVVPDMVVDRKQFNTDLDGDQFKVIFINKTGARVTAKGRTLFVEGGAPADKVKVIVKRNKNGGDRGAQICGVFSDSGVRVVKVLGALDRIETDGAVKMIKTKFGSLGQKNRSRLDYIRFRTYKGKSAIKVIYGDVSANICVNPASDTGKSGTGGLKALMVKGGDIGIDGTSRWLRAGYSRIIMVKPKKSIGGTLIDYSMYLSGESVPGSCASVKKIWANEIVDTSAVRSFMPNMKIICSYPDDVQDPRKIIDWTQYQVKCTISKVLVKGIVAEGTFVLNALPTRAKLPLNNSAIWIINGHIK